MDLLLYLTLSPASGLLLKTIEGKAFMTPELVSWLMLRHWEHYLITPFLQLLMAEYVKWDGKSWVHDEDAKRAAQVLQAAQQRMNFLD